MVINSDSDDSSTAKRNDFQKPRYRPQFLDHFERKNTEVGRNDEEKVLSSEYSPAAAELQQQQQLHNQQPLGVHPHAQINLVTNNLNANDSSNWENKMEMHFQQISAINQYGLQQHHFYNQQNVLRNQQQQLITPPAYPQQPSQQQSQQHQAPSHLHSQSHSYVDGEFEFLKFLTFDDLNQRLNNIDSEMEKEIEELNKKYNAKRQPIVDAMNAKRKRQQNINNNLIKI